MIKNIVLLMFVSLGLISCSVSRIEEGVAADNIFSVEKSNGGSYGIYLAMDESIVYCTQNEEFGELAYDIVRSRDKSVVIEFKERRWYEDTEGEALGRSQCGNYLGTFTPVIIVDMYRPGE